MAQTPFDGSQIKEFVENDRSFNKYVDKKFAALDTDHTGTLNHQKLEPVMGTLGEALGLPPPGTSKESDHIYDEVFAEFNTGSNVSKQTFAHVLKDVFMGLADGLQRDPISIIPIDGSVLREYAGTGKFDIDSVAAFTQLDAKQENKLPAIMLVEALKAIPVTKGMPPAGDAKMKAVVRDALVLSNVKTEDSLDQFQFVDAMKAVALAIADGMRVAPIEVAYSENKYDGSSIVALLKDQEGLQRVLDETWRKMPKDKKGRTSRDYLRMGVDEISPAAGLPPVGAVDEMDGVLKTVFSKIKMEGGLINRHDFDKTMKEVLGSLMLQLEGKPITIKNSSVVDPSSNSVGNAIAF